MTWDEFDELDICADGEVDENFRDAFKKLISIETLSHLDERAILVAAMMFAAGYAEGEEVGKITAWYRS